MSGWWGLSWHKKQIINWKSSSKMIKKILGTKNKSIGGELVLVIDYKIYSFNINSIEMPQMMYKHDNNCIDVKTFDSNLDGIFHYITQTLHSSLWTELISHQHCCLRSWPIKETQILSTRQVCHCPDIILGQIK